MRAADLVRAPFAALAFLTRVPVGRVVAFTSRDVGRGAAFFPLVGAGVGALAALVALGLEGPLSAFVAATCAVAAEALVTGAMHLDALADLADGLGARDPDTALAVMRDPSLGAFGGVALTVDVLLKVGAIAELLAAGGLLAALLAAGALGRAAPLALSIVLPYPGTEIGSGRALTDGHWFPKASGLALAASIAGLSLRSDAALPVSAALLAGIVVWLVGVRLGGATGDVLGGAAEATATATLVGAAAVA